jgi:hypothetical protein
MKICRGGIANYVSDSGGNTLLFELGSDADNEACSGDLDHRLRSFRCIAPGVPVIARVAPEIVLCKDQSHDDGYGYTEKGDLLGEIVLNIDY